MRKSTAVLCMIAALLVGVALTVYAQVTYVNVSVKYDNSTTIPGLGNVTPWVYAWHQVADSKGIAYGDCDAACRRQIVGTQMVEEFRKWQYARINQINTQAANATTAAQIEALRGVVE